MSSSQQPQHAQASPPVSHCFTKDELLHALRNADDHLHELQTILQSAQSLSGTSTPSPLQVHANEFLPVLFPICDVTTPAGQNRKLAALNAFWKLLLLALSSDSISESAFTDGIVFMLGQLWHGVFSHDWTDARKTRLAAFFASHLVSAVRAHPTMALAGPACGGIVDLFLALSEAVASGSHDVNMSEATLEAVTSRAKVLYTTVVVRLQGILECLGSAAVALASSRCLHGRHRDGEEGKGDDDDEEAAATGSGASPVLDLMQRCCSAGSGDGETGGKQSVLVSFKSSPSRQPSSFFTTPSSSMAAAPPPSAVTHVSLVSRGSSGEAISPSQTVRSLTSLCALLHIVRGMLNQQPSEGQQGPSAEAPLPPRTVQLIFVSLLLWLPGAPSLDRACDGGMSQQERHFMAQVRQAAQHLPPCTLWGIPRASSSPSQGLGSSFSDETAVEEASLRVLWMASVTESLSALLQTATCDADATQREANLRLVSRALLAILSTPHNANVALVTEALLHCAGGSEPLHIVLGHLLRAGCAISAQVMLLAEKERKRKQDSQVRSADGSSHSFKHSSSAAITGLWDVVGSIAVAVGSVCAIATPHVPPSRQLHGIAPVVASDAALDAGCFGALADGVFLSVRQDILSAVEDDEAEGADGSEGINNEDPIDTAMRLEALLNAITEGDCEDPQQPVRMLRVAPLFRRLRCGLDATEAEDAKADREQGQQPDPQRAHPSTAAKVIIRHRALQHKERGAHHRAGASTSPSPPPPPQRGNMSPSPSTTPASLSPVSTAMTASTGAFHAVLRAFSGTLSTLTRILTVEANHTNQNSGNGGAFLSSVVAASLLREAAFFPLVEPQDQLLTACIRRWVDLSFLTTAPSSSTPSGVPSKTTLHWRTALESLARHNAARSLVCFAQNNTGLSMDQLRLPEVAAVSLVRLLQGSSDKEDEEDSMGSNTLLRHLCTSTSLARCARRREEDWLAVLEQLPDMQREVRRHLAAHAAVGPDQKLLSALLTCKAALSAYMEAMPRHCSVDGESLWRKKEDEEGSATRRQMAQCLADVLTLGTSISSSLQGDGCEGREEDDDDDVLVRAVKQTAKMQAQQHRTRKGQRLESHPSKGEEVARGSSTSDGKAHGHKDHDGKEEDEEEAGTAPSLISSSIQLLASSQASTPSQRDPEARRDVKPHGSHDTEVVDVE